PRTPARPQAGVGDPADVVGAADQPLELQRRRDRPGGVTAAALRHAVTQGADVAMSPGPIVDGPAVRPSRLALVVSTPARQAVVLAHPALPGDAGEALTGRVFHTLA